MATRLAAATRNASANAAVDLLDGGASPGFVEIRTGTQPAGPDTTTGLGTLLVTVELAATAYGAASAGTAALAGTPLSGTAVATNTAGWFRMYHGDTASGGVGVIDGSVTATGGGGDLELDNTSIAVDQTVNITSLPYTQPASE